LKNDDKTNELCYQWVPCIPGTTTQDVPLLVHRTCHEAQEGVGSCCMPIQKGEIGVPAHPTEHLKAHK